MKLNIVSTVALVDINSKILIAKDQPTKNMQDLGISWWKNKKGETLEEALKEN